MSGQQVTLEGERKQELIKSAQVGDNSVVFPDVLDLHVDDGARIADVTYGKGVFWKRVDESRYETELSDLNPERSPRGEGIDCRDLPYADDSLDGLVFDPPYSEGLTRSRDESRREFIGRYSFDGELSELTHHDAIRAFYSQAAEEARRVLRSKGTFIVKCQDEVHGRRNYFTHIEIANDYADLNFRLDDLYVVVSRSTPTLTDIQNQAHARKNHSYFLVFTNDAEPGGDAHR